VPLGGGKDSLSVVSLLSTLARGENTRDADGTGPQCQCTLLYVADGYGEYDGNWRLQELSRLCQSLLQPQNTEHEDEEATSGRASRSQRLATLVLQHDILSSKGWLAIKRTLLCELASAAGPSCHKTNKKKRGTSKEDEEENSDAPHSTGLVDASTPWVSNI
jgi:hypothetical protein